MATRDEGAGLPIGEVLKRTRTRAKVDIRTVEQQTKIRIKYLRALENEEWDVLPGPAYAKGFLRTYAQFLGLDGDALVDEYRRTVETQPAGDHPYSFGEPLLERRLRPGEAPRSRWPIRVAAIAALGAAVVVVLVVVGLIGNDSSDKKHPHHKGKHAAHQQQGNGGGGGQQTPPLKPVTLALVTRDDMEICLVTGDGRALIDAQTLISGSHEGPFQPPADKYRLDLDKGGAVDLTLDGRPHPLDAKHSASFEITSNGIQPIDFKGPSCP